MPPKHKHYSPQKPQFDAFDSEAPRRAALGEQYIKAIMTAGGIQSADYVPGVSGWILLPTGGLKFGSSSGVFPPGSITFVDIQNIATAHILGRTTAGDGSIEQLTVGNGIEFSGSAIRRSALTGDVTASAGSNSTTIANDAVTNAKAANMATAKIKGRHTSGTGDPEDLSASQVKDILQTTIEEAEDASGITPVADGTYTVGKRLLLTGVDGTITVESGIITAIQEAT